MIFSKEVKRQKHPERGMLKVKNMNNMLWEGEETRKGTVQEVSLLKKNKLSKWELNIEEEEFINALEEVYA